LPTPDGLVSAVANAVSEDGDTVVGGGTNAAGEEFSIVWRSSVPTIFFEGTATAITPDGRLIVGQLDREDLGQKIGYGWTGPGYFTFYEGFTPEQTLTFVNAVSRDGTVVVGNHSVGTEVYPAFWSPSSSVTRIDGTITTAATAVSADGKLIGGGAPEGGIAFIWTPQQGTQNFGRLLAEMDLLDDLGGLGPGTINGISADRSRFAVSAYPGGGAEGSPRAFVIDMPNFMAQP
jgi:hypothetical protein